jgi:hypothetical protein
MDRLVQSKKVFADTRTALELLSKFAQAHASPI